MVERRICPKCGEPLLQSDLFCGNCGAKQTVGLETEQTQAQAQAQLQSQGGTTSFGQQAAIKLDGKTGILAIVGAVMVVVLLVSAAGYYTWKLLKADKEMMVKRGNVLQQVSLQNETLAQVAEDNLAPTKKALIHERLTSLHTSMDNFLGQGKLYFDAKNESEDFRQFEQYIQKEKRLIEETEKLLQETDYDDALSSNGEALRLIDEVKAQAGILNQSYSFDREAGLSRLREELQKNVQVLAPKRVEPKNPGKQENPNSAEESNGRQSSVTIIQQYGNPSSIPGRYPWTAYRAVTYDDLNGMSKEELDIMRNEIYARHGWIFELAQFRNYFGRQSWYQPGGRFSQRQQVNEAVSNSLTPLEKANAEKILEYQKAKGQW
ncbi:YARHG domain-containing protein [Heliobacterium chlorum]|uniref:YARHG domain-containing protein n=1 Tax=Heliobacterium chlorum TaxID=2698 RepID=A0ABR7SZY7_HELCL|nr:YARHG domain-containing protein [Heliobacterium chlorum]MBC9784113.1 YARHG domain-containing protein [Heliobacterium chlorum]